jgi:hypothetical protein
VLRGSGVDLAVGGRPPAALIEFKFLREPNEKNAAWTMVLGEVLKGFYRLATCPGPVDRLFVYLESTRLRRYMTAQRGDTALILTPGRSPCVHPTPQVRRRPARSSPSRATAIVQAILTMHTRQNEVGIGVVKRGLSLIFLVLNGTHPQLARLLDGIPKFIKQ